MIRTEDGEFHVLSVLESSEPAHIDFFGQTLADHQRAIEPDGARMIDECVAFSRVFPDNQRFKRLPNLARTSRPYSAMTENSATLKEENEYLRKQLGIYKVSLLEMTLAAVCE